MNRRTGFGKVGYAKAVHGYANAEHGYLEARHAGPVPGTRACPAFG